MTATPPLLTDSELLQRVSSNFGGCSHVRPAALARPQNASEVAEVVKHARDNGLRVAVRGAGHSQGLQNLVEGGIVVDTSALNDVGPVENGTIVVGAGATWSRVIAAAEQCSMLPPVLTDNPAVTVGGTLSIAGLGPASFSQGSQAHHCLGMQVVLASGEVRSISDKQDSRLFSRVLGGLGEFAVMASVTLALRPRLPFVRLERYSFVDLDPFLAAVDGLLRRYRDGQLGEDVLVEGFAQPAECGTRHVFVVEVAREVDDASQGSPSLEWLSGTSTHVDVATMETSSYVFRADELFQSKRYSNVPGLRHPWVETFLPMNAVSDYLARVLPDFTDTPILLWPMVGERARRTNFPLPADGDVMLVGIMAAVDDSQWHRVESSLRMAHALGVELGGKRYLSGWLDFDLADWERQFGDDWQEREAVRTAFDASNVFRLGG